MNKLKKILPILLTATLLLTSATGCTTTNTTSNTENTTITTTPVTINLFAAASLTNALTELNQKYKDSNPWVSFSTNFAGSGALQQQIENAVPGQVDIFISAASAQMNNLQNKNLLIDSTRKNLLNNNVVLIVPKNSTWNINSFSDLATATNKTLALGAPASVPAGAYAQEAFELLGIWDAVQTATKIVQFSDVTQVLTAVATGNADAGVVYSTDALSNSNVKVIAQAPNEINAKIVYPAAIIKGCNNVETAQEYIDFLFSNEARAIFEDYGFVIATQ